MDDNNLNNINQQYYDNSDNNRDKQQYNKPEYGFWADNIAGSGMPSHDYYQYQEVPQPAEKSKKKSKVKRFLHS